MRDIDRYKDRDIDRVCLTHFICLQFSKFQRRITYLSRVGVIKVHAQSVVLIHERDIRQRTDGNAIVGHREVDLARRETEVLNERGVG